jgi:hypothetical protein
MPDPLDVDLDKSSYEELPPEPPPPPGTSGLLILAFVALIAGGAIAAYFFFARRPAPPPKDTAPPAVTATPPAPLGGEAEAIDVPPLDQSDALVRRLVMALSSHPTVAAWLTTNGLIRNLVAVVENVAAGDAVAPLLQPVRPAGYFRITEHPGGEQFVDSASYRRYDAMADAVASIDAAGAARLYSTLKPRIEEAYRELSGAAPFDRTLERAFVELLDVPDIDGPVALVPRGVVYGYADEDLEELTAAQKQLLRMGPRNVRLVQGKLREIAAALGIPAERLPAKR